MRTRETTAPGGEAAGQDPAAGPSAARPRREPLRALTVLYDPHCRVCAFVGDWLAGQRKLIPVRLVPVGSQQARTLFPALDHDSATRREITVVGDAGQVYIGQSAWVVCLWALADHRALAHTLTTPAGRRLARATVLGVARYRDAQAARGAANPPYPRPARTPARTAPLGSPLAGRRTPEQTRTAWEYAGNGGWTPRGSRPAPRADPEGCADGCAPPP